MKVLFDLLTIRYAVNSGIVVYATRVLDGWYASQIRDVTILVSQYWEEMCSQRWPSYRRLVIDVPQTGYSRKGWIVGRKRKQIIDKSGCDVVFYPMPEPWFFEMPDIPQVTVVHDMLAPKIAKGKNWLYHHIMLPYQIARCRKIIAISEYTRKELLRDYSFLKPNTICVVRNPISWNNNYYANLLDYKYILCVNTIAPYKNGLTLVKAFNRIKEKTDCKLVFVGIIWGDYWSKIKEIADTNNFTDRLVHMQNLSDNDLVSLYQHASLFVSPSTMEGFGQTPIEAAIYKCPVITSRMAALPETTLGLLRYYNPVHSDEQLAESMADALFRNPVSEEELEVISEKMKQVYDLRQQSRKIYEELKMD